MQGYKLNPPNMENAVFQSQELKTENGRKTKMISPHRTKYYLQLHDNLK